MDWNNLSDDEKSRILDKYRYINVEYNDWWQPIFEVFREDMEKIGIEVEDDFSYEDGMAAFSGYVSDWEKFLSHLKYDDEWLMEIFCQNATFKVEIDALARYHMSVEEVDLPLPESDEEFLYFYGTGNELRDAAMIAALSRYDKREMVEDFLSEFRYRARELKRMLDEEYDWLTSDEAVLNALKDLDMLDEAIKVLEGEKEEDFEEEEVE